MKSRKSSKKVMYNYWMIRLRSNRGTDHTHCLRIPSQYSRTMVRRLVESYTDDYVDGTAISEYQVTYRKFKMPSNKRMLQSKCSIASKAHDKAKQHYYEMRAARYAYDFPSRVTST